jgi:hypothetical protein
MLLLSLAVNVACKVQLYEPAIVGVALAVGNSTRQKGVWLFRRKLAQWNSKPDERLRQQQKLAGQPAKRSMVGFCGIDAKAARAEAKKH